MCSFPKIRDAVLGVSAAQREWYGWSGRAPVEPSADDPHVPAAVDLDLVHVFTRSTSRG